MTSRERVNALLGGKLPDRPPHFDLIRNDAVLSHFAGEPLTVDNAERVVYEAVNVAVDATRPSVRLPDRERSERLPDGRRREYQRWTAWTERPKIELETYVRQTRCQIDAMLRWTEEDSRRVADHVAHHRKLESLLPDVYLFWSSPHAGPGLHVMCHAIGIDQFSLVMAEHPDLVSSYLESCTQKTIQSVKHIAQHAQVGVYMIGEDIAFKGATLFSPAFLRREFIGRLGRIVDAMHASGAKVMFHSDGDLMEILDDLVATGIDLLNPIEVMAGMDIAEIHRRAPALIMVGGIDVSSLLPHGTPDQVRAAVRKAIADAEGTIMPGSSTELQYVVPLANYLAMRDTIHSIRYD